MTKDVLVSAELAKEKLARICQEYLPAPTAGKVAQLIRNTDLTDCQPKDNLLNLLRDEYKRMRRECMAWKERAMELEDKMEKTDWDKFEITPLSPQEKAVRQKAMNEHSSGTRAQVPPSIPVSGTEPAGPAVDSASGAFQPATDGTAPVPAALRKRFEAWITAPPYERDTLRWDQSPKRAWPGQYKDYHTQIAWDACAWLAAQIGAPHIPTSEMMHAGYEVYKNSIIQCFECGEIYKAMEAVRTTEGNAWESARDAGSGINKEVVAPDQGSVRNATDMRERCARVCEEIATRSSLGTLREQDTADHCAAAIRALPDQKD